MTNSKDPNWVPGDSNRRKEESVAVIELSFIRKMVGGVGAIILIQLIAAIWWASSVTTSMEFVKIDVSSIKVQIAKSSEDNYRITDAKRDLAVVYDRIKNVEDLSSQNTARIFELQSKFKK